MQVQILYYGHLLTIGMLLILETYTCMFDCVKIFGYSMKSVIGRTGATRYGKYGEIFRFLLPKDGLIKINPESVFTFLK